MSGKSRLGLSMMYDYDRALASNARNFVLARAMSGLYLSKISITFISIRVLVVMQS